MILVQHFRSDVLITAGNGNGANSSSRGANREINFSSQSQCNRSNSAHSIPVAPVDQTRGNRCIETRFGFKATDLIVYPAHGVGQIVAIEEQAVAGAQLEFFVVYFAKSKMTLRVPIRKAASAGMRELSDPAAIQHARSILSQAPRRARGNWSRLAQEYESKIKSGDILAIAEAMRDLYRPEFNSSQSYSERQLYASALERLSGEIAVVDGVTEATAVRELESLMTEARRSA
jgi:CarD family transcriptional regulator